MMRRLKLTFLCTLMLVFAGLTAAYAAGPESFTKTFEAFTDEPENHMPEETCREYDTDYELESYTVVDDKLTGRTVPASDVIAYESVPNGMVPETAMIKVTDPVTGNELNVTGTLTNTEFFNEHWSDDFAFPITVHDYDANSYRLGDKIVKLDPVTPLKGYEDDLLALIGVSPMDYQIREIHWTSEPYTSSDGRLCRDLEATGGMKVLDCNATYEATAELPDLDAKRVIAVYRRVAEETEPETTVAETTVAETEPETTTAAPVIEKAPEEKKGFLGFITAVFEAIAGFVKENPVTVSVALLIIILAIAAFLVFPKWKSSNQRCTYDESVRCPYRNQKGTACRTCEYLKHKASK